MSDKLANTYDPKLKYRWILKADHPDWENSHLMKFISINEFDAQIYHVQLLSETLADTNAKLRKMYGAHPRLTLLLFNREGGVIESYDIRYQSFSVLPFEFDYSVSDILPIKVQLNSVSWKANEDV